MYEFYPKHQEIDIHDLVKLNFAAEEDDDQAIINILERWLNHPEYRKYFKHDKDTSSFTISPDIGEVEVEHVFEDTFDVHCFVGFMFYFEIIDAAHGKFTVKGNLIDRFLYEGTELDENLE